MSEAPNNPAEAGLGDQGNAQTDDIDTEAFDRKEVPDDDTDAEASAGGGGEGDEDGQTDGEEKAGDDEPDVFEIEDEAGAKHKVPAALKDQFLMRAAFTQKTQALAEQVRAFENQREAREADLSRQAEAFEALRLDHVKVSSLESRQKEVADEVATYAQVDWTALQQSDPDAYEAHRARQRQLRDTLIDLEEAVKGAKTELSTKEAKRLEDLGKAAETDRARAVEETGQALVRAIPGWNTQQATDTAKFMATDLGITVEEIRDATDPRIWIMAHRLRTAEAENATLKSAQKLQRAADENLKAQTTRPANTGKGGAGAHARDPSTARGDGLGTKEWMRKREAQVAAKRAAR